MIKTILVLLFTLIVVPLITWYFDEPLPSEHQQILSELIIMYVTVAGVCFVVSELTQNCSQVDKLWSIMPVIYAWYIAIKGGMDTRVVLMASLITLWGARLTFNFARRGGYSWKFWTGEEDYRWEVLRQNPALKGKWRWTLFNLFFISYYQMGLILLFTLPTLVALQGADKPLFWADYVLTAAFLIMIIIETVADQQQWNYQKEKYRRIKAGEKLDGIYAKGFVHTGMWKYMRHPNYMAEQSVWIIIYLFSVAATGKWVNWSVAGALLLIILFQGSSDFSEKISAQKYSEYKEYQKKTGRFIPRFW
jgi:steroid 5-alpha reductase family enzyme